MTSAQLSKLTIPLPFAGGTGAACASFGLSSGTSPNYTDGFPANYSAPKTAGGSFILRSQMNGLGNMASHNQWFHQAGGFYTFDADWCNAQSPAGYPKGAILHHVIDGQFVAVRSLVENNTWNFIEDGIDGEHWEICSPSALVFPTFDTTKRQILWNSMARMGESLDEISENFVMPFDGYVNYISTCNASLGYINMSVVTGIASGAATVTMIPFVPAQVIAGSVMGVIMGITSPAQDGMEADDVELDVSNYVGGTRNCAVFNVDGMGISAAGAGGGLIPVKKGSKIKLFGQETFSKTYSIQMQQQGGTSGSVTVQTNGSFSMNIRLEAYPIATKEA